MESPESFSKEVDDDINKTTRVWTGLRKTVKLTIQGRQDQTEVVPSASALIIRTHKQGVHLNACGRLNQERNLSWWPEDYLASRAKWFAVRGNESTDLYLADGVVSSAFFP
ncbi:60S ribosomal protein L12 [Cricetulus griseus]|uniref:60S ribosomal protein L12 n=1 Tax=Cricetulus griseus TaxID=10029 RepID=G3HVC5_CRIGR|nr:60S ribosomal protein L12 [Cricetulus griseus]